MDANSKTLIPANRTRARLGGISDMTLWRWQHDEALEFPKPVVIQGRRYWVEVELDAFQARLLTERAARPLEKVA